MIIPVFPHNLKQDRTYKRNNKFDHVFIITHATNSCITNKCVTGTNKNNFVPTKKLYLTPICSHPCPLSPSPEG